MRRRVALAVALLGAGLTTPAGAHDGGHGGSTGFPPLPPAATAHSTGSSPSGRAVERRVRRIETRVAGREHAIEHAEARALAAKLRGTSAHAYDLGSGKFKEVLQPTNDLPPQVGGQWQASQPLPIVAINAVQLHTGKVLYFSYPWRATEPNPDTGEAYGDGTPEQLSKWNYADAYLYDPATGQSREVPPPVDPKTGRKVELFCAGQSLMADGRVLITGGNVGNPAGDGPNKSNYGLNTTYVFDPDAAERGANPWTEGPRMRQGRWYPSQLLMPDGRTVITSGQANLGDQDQKQVNRDVDVYYPDDKNGTIENLSGSRLDGKGGRPNNVGQYPHMLWTPGGSILNYGPFEPDVWRMKAPVAGAKATTFTDLPNLTPTHRQWAGGFQIPGGPQGSSSVMLVGGADRTDSPPDDVSDAPALATTTFFDESRPDLGWRAGPTLNSPRAFANTVLLPTGKVAVVGGGLGNNSRTRYYRWTFDNGSKGGVDQRRVELLDPQNPQSTPVLGNGQAEGRTYHSTALLLPDGRVWSAGDDINGPRAVPAENPNTPEREGPDPNGGETFYQAQRQGGGSGVIGDTAEIWSPPYLFDANGNPAQRPQILQAPRQIAWGGDFTLRASADVTKAVLVAPGATTHAVDMSQRLVTLAAPRRAGSKLTIAAPSTRDIAPPGWYMLFGINDAGTPSVASWVRVGTAGEAPFPDDPPSAGTLPGTESGQPTTTSPDPVKPDSKRFRLGVQLTLASTLQRLRKGKRFSVVATVNAPAAVRIRAGQEVRRRVKVKGTRRTVRRTVALPVTRTRTTTLRKAGARRVRLTLSAAALKRLRATRSTTLRIVVTATPRAGGKAVTITRRPVLR